MNSRAKEQPHWYTQQQRFAFPASLSTGTIFKNVEEIQDLIDREAARTKLHIGTKGYKMRYQSKHAETGDWRRLRFICNICETQLNFVRDGNEILTMKVNVNHVHGPKQAEKRQKDLQYKRNYMRQRKRDRSHKKKTRYQSIRHKDDDDDAQVPEISPVKSKTTKQSQYITPSVEQQVKLEDEGRPISSGVLQSSRLNESSSPEKSGYPYEPIKTTSELELWLIENGYYFWLDWTNQDRQKCPSAMLLVSKTMKKNFLAFSDILSFELFDNLIKKTSRDGTSYAVGLFSVADSNSKPLIAGLTVFAKDTVETFKEIFCKLVEVYRKSPQTIITDERPMICQAIAHLRHERRIASEHIFSPWHLIQSFLAKLNGSTHEIAKVTLDIQTLVQERNRYNYDRLIASVRAYSNGKGILEDFDRLEKLGAFYLGTENAFVGLSRSYKQELHHILREKFAKKSFLMEFVRSFHGRVEQMTKQSMSCFDRLIHEVPFSDQKLEDLVAKTENQVAQRLVENYIKAIREYVMSEESTNQTSIVLHKFIGNRVTVKKWKCECRQLEKTGVACPHLIIATIAGNNRDYRHLLASRWIKRSQKLHRTQAHD